MQLLRNIVLRACEFAVPVVGATLIAYGAWLISPPAGFIVGGVLLFVVEHVLERNDGGRG